MGLLDSVLGAAMGGGQGGGAGALVQVLGSLLGGAQGGGGAGGALGGALGGAMGGLGGLGGLLSQLQQGGLGDAAASWVSTGQNIPVSADQLTAALGGDRIGQLAQQVGMPAGDLAGQLAQYLPQVVDKLTPNGQLPTGGGGADLGGMLSGVLGSLMSGR